MENFYVAILKAAIVLCSVSIITNAPQTHKLTLIKIQSN